MGCGVPPRPFCCFWVSLGGTPSAAPSCVAYTGIAASSGVGARRRALASRALGARPRARTGAEEEAASKAGVVCVWILHLIARFRLHSLLPFLCSLTLGTTGTDFPSVAPRLCPYRTLQYAVKSKHRAYSPMMARLFATPVVASRIGPGRLGR